MTLSTSYLNSSSLSFAFARRVLITVISRIWIWYAAPRWTFWSEFSACHVSCQVRAKDKVLTVSDGVRGVRRRYRHCSTGRALDCLRAYRPDLFADVEEKLVSQSQFTTTTSAPATQIADLQINDSKFADWFTHRTPNISLMNKTERNVLVDWFVSLTPSVAPEFVQEEFCVRRVDENASNICYNSSAGFFPSV